MPQLLLGGEVRPENSPSIFPNIPSSLIPTPAPKPRETKESSAEIRFVIPDELSQFLPSDMISNFETMCTDIQNKTFSAPITMYQIEDKLHIQSNKYLTDSIPLFLIKVSHNMKFECYHSSVRSYSDSLSRNRITTFSRWSQIEEAIRFLNLLEVEHKKSIMKEQVEVMTPQVIDKIFYEPSY